MKKIVFLLVFSVMSTMFVEAGPVSERTARASAEAFLASRGKQVESLTMAPARRGMETESTAPYYAFNVENDGGFVVVSGDDNLDPILGYADQGGIDLNNLPDGLQYMLDCYAAAPARTPVVIHRTVRTPIAPLIQTKWNQYEPYNRFTPLYSDTTKNVPTGCAATAMAQVMKYWNWPQAACQPLPGYRPPVDPNDTIAPVPATTFDWANMLNTYSGSESEAEKDAVAKLMEYCGKSILMEYTPSYAGAYGMCTSYAFKTYFDYDPGVQVVSREHYSYAQWISLIYNELAEGRPVCYYGVSVGGGHAFVCDGYDSDDYFHFNWGWGGTSDGYFRLVNPNPYNQGAGGSSTNDGFSMYESATIGIQPSTQPSGKNYCLILEDIYFEMQGGHQLTVFKLCSQKNGTNLFDINLRLYNPDGTLYRDIWTWEAETIEFVHTRRPSYFFYDENIDDGIYQVKLFSRMTGESEWKECMDWEAQPVTLTVTNGHDTTTTTHPAYFYPADATLSVEGNQQVDNQITVTAHVTGGDADYSDILVLRVNGLEVMGFQVDIPAHETRDVVFTYVPTAAGSDTLLLYAGEVPIGSDTVIQIQASDASQTSDQVALNTSFVIHNIDNNSLYGGRMQASIIFSNPSADTTYYGTVWIYLYEQLPGETRTIYYREGSRRRVPPSDSLVIDLDRAGLVAGAQYYLATYVYRYTPNGYVWDYAQGDAYYMISGYEVYDAEGRSTLHPLRDTLNISDATFVDFSLLTGQDTVNCFVPSSNPNCVYVLNDTVTLSWAAGLTNTVRNGHTDSLTLTDGHAFFTPVEFTATNVQYRRPYRLGASTICLPFDVPQVPGGLLSFDYEMPGNVVFSGPYRSLEANTPYLFIGSRQSAADSILLFTGDNATIQPSKVAIWSGNYYKFSGSTYVMALEDVYVEGEGGGFSHQNFAVSQPFRAWFRDSEIAPYPVEMLDIRLLPTDVENVRGQMEDVRCEKVLRDGVLYILRDGIVYDVLGRVVRERER